MGARASRDSNFVNYDENHWASYRSKHGTLVTVSFDYVLLGIHWDLPPTFSSNSPPRKLDNCPPLIFSYFWP